MEGYSNDKRKTNINHNDGEIKEQDNNLITKDNKVYKVDDVFNYDTDVYVNTTDESKSKKLKASNEDLINYKTNGNESISSSSSSFSSSSLMSSDNTSSSLLSLPPKVISKASSAKALILVLVGLPGSGKTTFASAFCNEPNTTRVWYRVCQDELKKNVISRTKSYLKNGHSVLIDRCNFNKKQRNHWVKIAKMATINAPIFALVLPRANDVEFCSERAINRKNDGFHTLNNGITWPHIIQSMSSQYKFPKLYEGFTHVFNCSTDIDLQNALQVLKQL